MTGIDGGATWRGTYRTEAECAALLLREGGVRGVMAAGARTVGLSMILNPVRGDVGVVQVWSGSGQIDIGAICTGTRWAAMSKRGLRLFRAKSTAAWRLPHYA